MCDRWSLVLLTKAVTAPYKPWYFDNRNITVFVDALQSTKAVTTPYKPGQCNDCKVAMNTNPVRSEYVCPRCSRVELIDGVSFTYARPPRKEKKRPVYLEKCVNNFFKGRGHASEELIRQVELIYLSLEEFNSSGPNPHRIKRVRPKLTFLIPAILDLLLPPEGVLRSYFDILTRYRPINNVNFTKTQLRDIALWKAFLADNRAKDERLFTMTQLNRIDHLWNRCFAKPVG